MMTTTTPSIHRLLPLIAAALFLWLSTQSHAQGIQPITDRLDAIVSYPLVVSIEVEDESKLRSGVITRLDDGRELVSEPFWVGLIPYRTLPTWIRTAGRWEAIPYAQARNTPREQRPPGAWFISIPIPIDAVGQGLWFGQNRFELNWLPDPERALLEADTAAHTRDFTQFWAMHLDAQALSDPSVKIAIEQYHRDPFLNWRSRLLTDGLDPDRTRARETHALNTNAAESIEFELQNQTPATELLQAIARQQEARWQIILGRIWLIDPHTANRMKLALTRTVRIGSRTLPLWNDDNTELGRLAHDLLSPFVNDDTRVLRAKAWLETQPRAVSWIIDDQGTIEAGTERLLPTLGIISLPSELGNSMLRIDADLNAPLLETIPPNTLQIVRVPIDSQPISSLNPQISTTPVTMRLGRWAQIHQLLASPVPATAPHARIGPLLADWTMPALVRNQTLLHASLEAERTTTGLLWRNATPSRSAPRAGWRLFLECASTDPANASESLTLWIGPREYPTVVWKITPDARVEVLQSNTTMLIPPPTVETRILENQWIAQIDLPEQVFDRDDQFMLGIERTDAQGVHSAWPRRMLPGQSEPGRIIITPERYDGLRIR